MAETQIAKPTTQGAEQKQALNITDHVQREIHDLVAKHDVTLPEDYAVGNAIQSAYLNLLEVKDMAGNHALSVCDKASIIRALRNMLIQGLTVDKKQGYFIVYGNQLTFQRSYFGTMTVAKRFADVLDVIPQVVVEGDDVTTEIVGGEERVTQHIRKNRFGKQITKENIIGAYCVVRLRNGVERWTIMDKWQIQAAWNKSRSKAQAVHNEFPDQMAMRTVINRALKLIINSSDDSPLLVKAFNESGFIPEDGEDDRNNELPDSTAFKETIAVSAIKSQAEPKLTPTGSYAPIQERLLETEGDPF